MIQRVQSIFLLLVAVCCFLLFKFDFATITTGGGSSVLFADKAYDVQDNTILLIMFSLAGILAFANIFLFNNRKRQLAINNGLIILNLLGVGLAVFLYTQDMNKLSTEVVEDGLGLYLPIIAFVFILLASRFIKKDEDLVKSMDRLR